MAREPADSEFGDERAGGAGESGSGRAGGADDALRRLTDRLDQASDAAERLFAQATEEAASRIGDRLKPPARGWQRAEDANEDRPPAADAILLMQSLRELIPADLQRRLAEAVRELLLALRALIDWAVERLEQRRREPVQVQDIPVL